MLRTARRRGQSLVETALVLPVLLMLVFAGIDLFIIINDSIVVQEAARSGASAAAISGGNLALARTAVENTLRGGGTTDVSNLDRVTLVCNPTPCRRYSQITVTVTYTRPYVLTAFSDGGLTTRVGTAVRLSERDS